MNTAPKAGSSISGKSYYTNCGNDITIGEKDDTLTKEK